MIAACIFDHKKPLFDGKIEFFELFLEKLLQKRRLCVIMMRKNVKMRFLHRSARCTHSKKCKHRLKEPFHQCNIKNFHAPNWKSCTSSFQRNTKRIAQAVFRLIFQEESLPPISLIFQMIFSRSRPRSLIKAVRVWIAVTTAIPSACPK